jgi:ribosomal protein L21E
MFFKPLNDRFNDGFRNENAKSHGAYLIGYERSLIVTVEISESVTAGMPE